MKCILGQTVRRVLGTILKAGVDLHNRSDNLQDLQSLISVIKQEAEITECDLWQIM